MRRILIVPTLAISAIISAASAQAQTVTGSFNGYTGTLGGSSSASISGMTLGSTSTTSGGNASNQAGSSVNVAVGATGGAAYMGQSYASLAGPNGVSVVPVNGFMTTSAGATQNAQLQTFSVNTVGPASPGTASGTASVSLPTISTSGSGTGSLAVSGCNGPACINPGSGGLNNQ